MYSPHRGKVRGEVGMIEGDRILLRPVQDGDWPTFEEWGESREALWGPFQRFQMDHVPLLREAFQRTGLLQRESGLLLIETIEGQQAVGYVRYTMLGLPDADLPYPEVGFGIPEVSARRQGYAQETVRLLVEYLFAGYPVERVAGFTDAENRPARQVMEKVGFQQEGELRRALFRDGQWCDVTIYSILRQEMWSRSSTGKEGGGAK
jgi:RimJ/RimL family protein N-acetyltransferase